METIKRFRGVKPGFTLIELLIVIAIILILIAIALPNFLEARIRAQVTKVMSEQRILETALEAYGNDTEEYGNKTAFTDGTYLRYPLALHHRAGLGLPSTIDDITVRWGLTELTTPISYLTDLPGASFTTLGSREGGNYNAREDAGSAYEPALYFQGNKSVGWKNSSQWLLRDTGPDQVFNNAWMTGTDIPVLYSATNGTISRGDIMKFGP